MAHKLNEWLQVGPSIYRRSPLKLRVSDRDKGPVRRKSHLPSDWLGGSLELLSQCVIAPPTVTTSLLGNRDLRKR